MATVAPLVNLSSMRNGQYQEAIFRCINPIDDAPVSHSIAKKASQWTREAFDVAMLSWSSFKLNEAAGQFARQ
jgi:hypothetical protein